jgi:dihydrodipicolinate synthase/N-acetylneuraminate lyase
MILDKLTGVIPAIGTPLTEGDRVDVEALQRLTGFLLEEGAAGIFVNGSMGGFAFLPESEQLRAIDTVAGEVNGRVPVMAGLGETSTSRALPLARQMARLGIDYLSVLPPFYFRPAQEHVIAYVFDIIAAIDIPVVLYDNPVSTKCQIHPETVAEIRRRAPRLVGIKESNEDCVNLQRLLDLMRGERQFSILTGSEQLALVGLQMGVDGCIGGLYNLCPRIAVDLYEAFRAGNLDTARRRQAQIQDLCGIFRYGHIWGAFDEALRFLGLGERATGAPYITRLSAEDRQKVHDLLSRHLTPHRLTR